ncbi:hypothetical protein [[Clostridium] fimetarium]|uniref:Lipoprotein n=1 Tax=[Clostridium] fimetarium TaxID=99656 RepID=A0A1I0M867_9FIRM|nr:hypothetical protein [[Clostridium] fimetarium]SEV83960.1 hypothetical protein SAMN05421659_101241 [[Clostridium] fimetarium]
MKNIKLVIASISLLLIGSLTACAQTDVIGKVSKTSFESVLKTIPNQVKPDEMNGGWSLSAPDNSARFIWSKDYSKSPIHDVMLEFDSAPFIAAGLDVNKLPAGIVVEDKIMLGTKLGNNELKYSGEVTPLTSFNQIVDLYRASIGYHEVLDHYGVDLGSGNKFEWSKDMSKNDKDIVFVVNPEIFIAAGVDPDKVEGWKYASVQMKDNTGKTIEVMKFLKPFNLQ